MNEKQDVNCSKCGNRLFVRGADGECFYVRRGVKYGIQYATCCGITVTAIEARYNTENQISGPMADATASPNGAAG